MRKYTISFIVGLVILCVMTWLIVTFVNYTEIKSLPLHTFSTIFRIVITLLISIAWGVSFGILAATNKVASLVITPFVDLLQSIPILGYFPMVIGFLFTLPFGIELSVIVLLFTSMAWAIFFGVLGAIRGIPTNVADSAQSFGLTGWKYVRHVILPAITPAIVSGANLAWCDGWFFMIAAEYIQYQGKVIFPPSGGLGYLLAKAAYEYQDMNLALILLVFITFIVVYFNTLTWHRLMELASTGTFKPVFRMDLSGVGKLGIAKATSWMHFGRLHWPKSFSIASQRLRKYTRIEKIIAAVLAFSTIIFVFYLVFGQFPTLTIIRGGLNQQPAEELVSLPLLIAFTMGRLTIAYGIALTVAITMGVLAAEHKRFATVFYPLYDIGQGVPILALFPVIFLGLNQLLGNNGRIALELTCIIMLVLDMIWYMFLNIVSAVKNIPTEIKEVGQLLGFKGMKRITHIIVPSILPSIVTGSILSWGTGWNTIIFAEYLQSTGQTSPLSVPGIGSLLDKAGYEFGNTVVLILILGVIAAIVLLMEGLVWRRLLRKFEKYHVEGGV